MSGEKRKRPVRSRFPKTSLKAANLVQVGTHVGILRDAIDDDVEYLLYHFRSQPNHSFDVFDNIWNELHFSLVHFACVKRDYRESYMNAFHSSVLGIKLLLLALKDQQLKKVSKQLVDHFRSPSTAIKCGVIFMLYFFFVSQPKIWGKIRIRASKETWKLLLDFYTESIQKDTNVEAVHIFDKLRELGAFIFVHEEKVNQYFVPERIEFEREIKMLDALHELKMKRIEGEAVDSCMNPELEELHNIATEYQSVKRETFCTPQAFIATQKNLKETLNVTEIRSRLLQNVLLNSTVAHDETDNVKRISSKIQQMWNSKKRKLEDKNGK